MNYRSALFYALLLIVAAALIGCSGPADDEPPAAAAPTAAAPLPAATAMITDLGFRPEVHGFNFENYSDETQVQNLTAVEVRRLFGDEVCATLADGRCVLTPPGQQWMEQVNGDMKGGHCEGMAVLSLLMYTDQVTETLFGGQNAIDLAFNNAALQREIAYWWATQATAPTADRIIKGTPNEILARLKEMAPGRETYTIGVYKPDGSDGHAVTPFGLAAQADGSTAILVYDNNYPKEVRRVVVDSRADTWAYEAAVNPQAQSELYEGNAETQTLDLTPTSARLTRQACPFCAGARAARRAAGWRPPRCATTRCTSMATATCCCVTTAAGGWATRMGDGSTKSPAPRASGSRPRRPWRMTRSRPTGCHRGSTSRSRSTAGTWRARARPTWC